MNMNPSIKIPAWRIFTNWIIAVLTGSIVWPLVTSLSTGELQMDKYAPVIVLSMVFSALCSLPAIIILLIAHIVLNNRNVSLKDHRRIHTTIHLLAGVLTFTVIYLIFAKNESAVVVWTLVIPLTYMAAGFTTAMVTYRIYEKRQQQLMLENQDSDFQNI